jgi:glycosyltransferase involved in cell wall biosynthesis
MAGRVADQADVVVVPTRAVERALRRHLAPRRIEVVGEGVASVFRAPGAVPEDLDLPADGYLVTLATMEPRKGLDVLVRALAQPGAPDLPLLVVGQQGWGHVDPVGMAADLGLPAGRVRVLGRLPDAALVPVLAGATVLVVPSRAEGFGLPVLEGMALGVPVVTSDDPALVEVGGDAAAAVPVGDPAALAAVLGEVVADPARRAAMAEAGRGRAATQTWDAAASRLVDVYAGLLG